jgi:hypothetical protein
LYFDDFGGKFGVGVSTMCTVTLELPDELVELAQKQGLLSPGALESYIRKSLEKPVFFKAKTGNTQKDDLDETLEELWELCKDVPITVDSFLEERHAEAEREEAGYRE